MSSRFNIGTSFNSSWSKEKTGVEAEEYVVGVYRYPRAVIRLPVAVMKPTEKFKNELAAAMGETKDPGLRKQRLIDFFTEYGQTFASEVYLGGHLHMSMHAKQTDTVSIIIDILSF